MSKLHLYVTQFILFAVMGCTTLFFFSLQQFYSYTLALPWVSAAMVYHCALLPQTRPGTVYILLLGILQDTLSGTPLGLQTTLMLLLYGITRHHSLYYQGSPFQVIWTAFALYLALAYVLTLVVLAWLFETPPALQPILSWVATCLLFPLLHQLMLLMARLCGVRRQRFP